MKKASILALAVLTAFSAAAFAETEPEATTEPVAVETLSTPEEASAEAKGTSLSFRLADDEEQVKASFIS